MITTPAIPNTDDEAAFEIGAVIACLEDDAAALREENSESEVAANMERAAQLLQGLPLAAEPPDVPSWKYLLGHRHGLEWASQVVAADDPRTGDWLYDDRHDLANAIHRGPDVPQEWHASLTPFQARVKPWLLECFGEAIAGDREERNHRFLEEALELVQACGCTASEAHQLVDYTFGRPVGEKAQEVGGVMVTLAALCLAQDLDMHAEGETELTRISAPELVARIRAKQAAKPKHSPLPAAPAEAQEPMFYASPGQAAALRDRPGDNEGGVYLPLRKTRAGHFTMPLYAIPSTREAAPTDPMDWPLPCDVTVGHGTMRKGVTLRTLVNRMKTLYEMATGQDADAVAGRTLEERQALAAKFLASVTPAAGETCSACQGSGEQQVMTNHLGPDDYEVTGICASCGGTGVAPDDMPLETGEGDAR